MSDLTTHLDVSGGPGDGARIKAMWYLHRTGNRDLWEVLGLVHDPIAERARRAKAINDMHGKRKPPPVGPAPAGYCPECNNRRPKSGVCRRTIACRHAAQEAK